MAIPGSGPVSLGDIQTEFGGTNPISISEYYGADAGVPGSGAISMSDFYGTSSSDITMDTLSFFPTTLGPTTSSSPATSSATVSGINQNVTIDAIDSTLEGTFTWRINSGSYSPITSSLSVANGDTITIKYETNITTIKTSEFNGAIIVRNVTDSNTTVGTLSCQSFDTGAGL